jgi:hypothetical protein
VKLTCAGLEIGARLGSDTGSSSSCTSSWATTTTSDNMIIGFSSSVWPDSFFTLFVLPDTLVGEMGPFRLNRIMRSQQYADAERFQ